MKLLFLSTLIAFGGLFKYGSMIEAVDACVEWAERGEIIRTVPKDSEFLDPFWDRSDLITGVSDSVAREAQRFLDGIRRSREEIKRRNLRNTRWCVKEEETRQYLGHEIDQSGIRGKSLPEGYKFDSRIKKRFRY